MSGNWMAGQETELLTHTGNNPKEVEKTLLHNKKHIVSTCYSGSDASTIYKNFSYAYGGGMANSNQYDNRNDAIYIRFALTNSSRVDVPERQSAVSGELR